jgi:hypothetical protein
MDFLTKSGVSVIPLSSRFYTRLLNTFSKANKASFTMDYKDSCFAMYHLNCKQRAENLQNMKKTQSQPLKLTHI